MSRFLESLLPTRPRRPSAGLLALLLLLRLAGNGGSADAMKMAAAPAASLGFSPVLPTMYWADLLGDSPKPTQAPNVELVKRATDPKTCGFESGFGVYCMSFWQRELFRDGGDAASAARTRVPHAALSGM
jgi:hypothetical protein